MSASTGPLVCTLAQLNGPGLLGFLVQCSVCPQQALVAAQPDGEWLCPRCAEVAERAPVRHRIHGSHGLCRSCYNRRHSDPEIAELVAQAKDERRAAS